MIQHWHELAKRLFQIHKQCDEMCLNWGNSVLIWLSLIIQCSKRLSFSVLIPLSLSLFLCSSRPFLTKPWLSFWQSNIVFYFVCRRLCYNMTSPHSLTHLQCDQIGRISKVLGEIFCFKKAEMYSDFLAILKNIHFPIITALATFWATFGNIWATFNFSIWSHCSLNRHSKTAQFILKASASLL